MFTLRSTPTWLTQQQVASVLELDKPETIGNLLESLRNTYDAALHKNFNATSVAPGFVVAAMGPPLERLPSFGKNTDKHAFAEDVAQPGPNGFDGMGEVMETMHSNMRALGGRVSAVFAPAMKPLIAGWNLSGDMFDTREVLKLKGINKVSIALDKNKKPLEIEGENIVYNAFMIGAEARAHLTRSTVEQDMLRESVGVLKTSYINLLKLTSTIDKAIRANPDYKRQTAADFGLAMNTGKIAAAFTARQQEFCDAYNYIYANSGGNLDPHLQALRWAIERRKAPNCGIVVRNPQDAAGAIAGLYDFSYEYSQKHNKHLCENIASRSGTAAAMLIEEHEIIPELKSIATAMPAGEAKHMHRIIAEVERYHVQSLPPLHRQVKRYRDDRDSGSGFGVNR